LPATAGDLDDLVAHLQGAEVDGRAHVRRHDQRDDAEHAWVECAEPWSMAEAISLPRSLLVSAIISRSTAIGRKCHRVVSLSGGAGYPKATGAAEIG
jgi:hypothetical protein